MLLANQAARRLGATLKWLYLGDDNDISSKYSQFTVSTDISSVAPGTLTVATDISHRGTGIYGRPRGAWFDELSPHST